MRAVCKGACADGEQAVRCIQRFQTGALESAVANAYNGFRQYDFADLLVAAKGGLADLLDRKVTRDFGFVQLVGAVTKAGTSTTAS